MATNWRWLAKIIDAEKVERTMGEEERIWRVTGDGECVRNIFAMMMATPLNIATAIPADPVHRRALLSLFPDDLRVLQSVAGTGAAVVVKERAHSSES